MCSSVYAIVLCAVFVTIKVLFLCHIGLGNFPVFDEVSYLLCIILLHKNLYIIKRKIKEIINVVKIGNDVKLL